MSAAPARRGGGDLVGPAPEDPLAEHGDRDHEQDDREEQVDDLRGDARGELQPGRTGSQHAHEEGRGDRGEGVGPGQEGDGDAVEAQGAPDGRLEPVEGAHRLEGTRQAGEPAAEDHRQGDDAADRDPCVARGVLVGSDGVEAEPERGAAQHPPAQHRQEDCEDEADGDAGRGADPGRLRDQLGLRDAAGLRGLGLERADDEPPGHTGGDVVEHDRRDDLVHPAGRLEDSGDEADERAGEGSRHHAEDGAQEAGAARGIGDPRTEHGAEDELPLTADVEEADPQREDDREAGQDERGRLLQRPGEAARDEQRLTQQRLVRVPRVDALVADQGRADEEGDDECHDDDDATLVAEQVRQRLGGALFGRRWRLGPRRRSLFRHRGGLGHVTPMSVGAHSVACRGPGQKGRAASATTRWGRAPGRVPAPSLEVVGSRVAVARTSRCQSVTPVSSVPASICLTTSSTFALTSAGTTDSKSWYGARPALPSVWSSVKSPSLAWTTVSVTPSLMSFIAEVTRHGWAAGTVSHWSVSTPMQNLSVPAPAVLATSWRAPLPVLPPAPKMTSAPWASCFFASPAPHTGSLKALSAAGW